MPPKATPRTRNAGVPPFRMQTRAAAARAARLAEEAANAALVLPVAVASSSAPTSPPPAPRTPSASSSSSSNSTRRSSQSAGSWSSPSASALSSSSGDPSTSSSPPPPQPAAPTAPAPAQAPAAALAYHGGPSDTPPFSVLGDVGPTDSFWTSHNYSLREHDGQSVSRQLYLHRTMTGATVTSANKPLATLLALASFRLAIYPWRMYFRPAFFSALGLLVLALGLAFFDSYTLPTALLVVFLTALLLLTSWYLYLLAVLTIPQRYHPSERVGSYIMLPLTTLGLYRLGQSYFSQNYTAQLWWSSGPSLIWLALHIFDLARAAEYLRGTPRGVFPGVLTDLCIRACALAKPLARLVVAACFLAGNLGSVENMFVEEWVELGQATAGTTLTLAVLCGVFEVVLYWVLGGRVRRDGGGGGAWPFEMVMPWSTVLAVAIAGSYLKVYLGVVAERGWWILG